VKNSRATLFFRASASCLKILNNKKYNQYSKKFQGKLFSGQARVVKNPACKKYIQYSEKFQGNCFFRASASCSKIVNDEKIFNTVYIHLEVSHVIWASAICNLDQSRDWL